MDNKKILAFIVKILLKLAISDEITHNEIQSLSNIADDLDADELKEDEFRY